MTPTPREDTMTEQTGQGRQREAEGVFTMEWLTLAALAEDFKVAQGGER